MNMTKKMVKMAQKDAERFAAAEMFYGEGAGTRRKLLNAELQSKFNEHPEYESLVMQAYHRLDLNKFAEKAIKERKAIDRAAKLSRNARAFKSGNYQNLTTGVFVAVGAYWLAKQAGYDKKIEAEARKAKAWVVMKYKIRKAKTAHAARVAYYSEENDGQ